MPQNGREGPDTPYSRPLNDHAQLDLCHDSDQATTSKVKTNNPTCYYLPGKVSTRRVHFLLDSGCTNSIISRHVFDALPSRIKQTLQLHDHSTGRMADGSSLTIYGKLTLPCKLRHVKVEHEFFIAKLQDDAILGMNFLEQYSCKLQFGKPILTILGHELICTDQWGDQLINKISLVHNTTVPPMSETTLVCRLNTTPQGEVGIVESYCVKQPELRLAASLNSPDAQQRVVVRCLNATSEEIVVRSGTILGTYQPIDTDSVVTASDKITISNVTINNDDHSTDVPDHLRDLYDHAVKTGLTLDQQLALRRLLHKYADVFSTGESDIGLTNLVKHSIPLKPNTAPIRQPPRRLGPEKDQEVARQVADLQRRGLIEPADGAWSSPVVLVRKKDQTWRLCIDYRLINAATVRDAYPLPRIDDSLDSLVGSSYFSTLDLLAGYWQVPLDDDAREKSAFVTRGGLWRWKVLPFGLTSAPASFERLMEHVLRGLQWKTLLLYLDDVIVFSNGFDSHIERLEEILCRFREANLKLKPSKCELFQTSVAFLGHIVSKDGVATDPKKVEAIRQWPTPPVCRQPSNIFRNGRILQKILPGYGFYSQTPLPANFKECRIHLDFYGTKSVRYTQELTDLSTSIRLPRPKTTIYS